MSVMCDMCDNELITLWQRGDRTAVEILIRRHDAALETVLSQKASSTVCGELKQRVWKALIERPPREIHTDFRAYLRGTARHIASQFYERESRDLAYAEKGVLLTEFETSLSEKIARKIDAQKLMLALQQLHFDDQDVLLMRYVDELSEAEMAEILEVPRGTVKSRLFNAKRKLRDAWPAGRSKA